MIDELERMRKEIVMSYSRYWLHMSGKAEENQEHLRQDSRWLGL
jgi:hypothetical protein